MSDEFWRNLPAILVGVGAMVAALIGALIPLITVLRGLRQTVAAVTTKVGAVESMQDTIVKKVEAASEKLDANVATTEKLEHATNGMHKELLLVTGQKERAEGIKEGEATAALRNRRATDKADALQQAKDQGAAEERAKNKPKETDP